MTLVRRATGRRLVRASWGGAGRARGRVPWTGSGDGYLDVGDKAKLLTTGRDQAVLLPEAYRFEGKEVWIREDPPTGDVIPSRRPPDWSGLFELDTTDVPEDFMGPIDRDRRPHDRDPFADEDA